MLNDTIEVDPEKVRKLKTKTWYSLLSKQAGYKSVTWFAENTKFSRTSWQRYKSGSQPSTQRKGRSAVDEMAIQFPGSEKIFYSKIWDVLAGTPVFPDEGTAEILELGEVVKGIAAGGGYWKNSKPGDKIHIEDMMSQLKDVVEFDSLRAVLLKLGMADNAKNVDYWNGLCDLYNEMLPELILDEDIPFRIELFDLIDVVARRFEYHDAAHIYRPPQNWRDRLPDYRILLKEIYTAGVRNHDCFILLSKTIFSDEEREEMVEAMLEIVWKDPDLVFCASELWKPLGWFFFEAMSGRVPFKDRSESEFLRLAKKSIRDWQKEKWAEELEWRKNWKPSKKDDVPMIPNKNFNQYVGAWYFDRFNSDQQTE